MNFPPYSICILLFFASWQGLEFWCYLAGENARCSVILLSGRFPCRSRVPIALRIWMLATCILPASHGKCGKNIALRASLLNKNHTKLFNVSLTWHAASFPYFGFVFTKWMVTSRKQRALLFLIIALKLTGLCLWLHLPDLHIFATKFALSCTICNNWALSDPQPHIRRIFSYIYWLYFCGFSGWDSTNVILTDSWVRSLGFLTR